MADEKGDAEQNRVFQKLLNEILNLLGKKVTLALKYACFSAGMKKKEDKEEFLRSLSREQFCFVLFLHGLINRDLVLCGMMTELLSTIRRDRPLLHLPELEIWARRTFTLTPLLMLKALNYSAKVRRARLFQTPKGIYRILAGCVDRVLVRESVRVSLLQSQDIPQTRLNQAAVGPMANTIEALQNEETGSVRTEVPGEQNEGVCKESTNITEEGNIHTPVLSLEVEESLEKNGGATNSQSAKASEEPETSSPAVRSLETGVGLQSDEIRDNSTCTVPTLFIKKEKGLEDELCSSATEHYSIILKLFRKHISPTLQELLLFAEEASIYSKEFTMRNLNDPVRSVYILFIYSLITRDKIMLGLTLHWFGLSSNKIFPLGEEFSTWLKSGFIFQQQKILGTLWFIKKLKKTNLFYFPSEIYAMYVGFAENVKIRVDEVMEKKKKKKKKVDKIQIQTNKVSACIDPSNTESEDLIEIAARGSPLLSSLTHTMANIHSARISEATRKTSNENHRSFSPERKRKRDESPNEKSIDKRSSPYSSERSRWSSSSSSSSNLLSRSLMQPQISPNLQQPLIQYPRVAPMVLNNYAATPKPVPYQVSPGLNTASQAFTCGVTPTRQKSPITPLLAYPMKSIVNKPISNSQYPWFVQNKQNPERNSKGQESVRPRLIAKPRPPSSINQPLLGTLQKTKESLVALYSSGSSSSDSDDGSLHPATQQKKTVQKIVPPQTPVISASELASSREKPDLMKEKERDLNVMKLKAANEGKLSALQLMMKENPDLRIRNDDGQTMLHLTAKNGHEIATEFLVSLGLELNSQDNSGNTPLHLAASEGRMAILEILIEHGASLTVKNKNGMSAYDTAIACNQKLLAEKLRLTLTTESIF